MKGKYVKMTKYYLWENEAKELWGVHEWSSNALPTSDGPCHSRFACS